MSIINRPALESATPERPAIDGAQFIPISLIRPNPKQPRKRFDPAAITELADSIERFGVLQPILARPIDGARPGQPLYEIVAGERRWRACTELAKRRGEESIAVIPVIVREMTDFEVLELATVENLHRKDLHPLEEAEGYEALLRKPLHGGEFSPPRLHGYSVDELAARVGKSKSYIFGRLKLCALVPAAREAFYGDQLNASVALLIARMPAPVQEAALPTILSGWGGEPYSFRQARDLLERDFMLELSAAPFPVDSPLLLPAAGACSACPKRSGANPELFGDVVKGDVCLDAACFRAKRVAWVDTMVADARAVGTTVLTDAAADAVIRWGRTPFGLRHTGWVDIDAEDHGMRLWRNGQKATGTLRELLGDDLPPVTLVVPSHGDPLWVVPIGEAETVCEAAGWMESEQKASAPSAGSAGEGEEEGQTDEAAPVAPHRDEQIPLERRIEHAKARRNAEVDRAVDEQLPKRIEAEMAGRCSVMATPAVAKALAKILDDHPDIDTAPIWLAAGADVKRRNGNRYGPLEFATPPTGEQLVRFITVAAVMASVLGEEVAADHPFAPTLQDLSDELDLQLDAVKANIESDAAEAIDAEIEQLEQQLRAAKAAKAKTSKTKGAKAPKARTPEAALAETVAAGDAGDGQMDEEASDA